SIDLARGERLQAQAVVLATPAYATADLIESLVPDMAATLREIPYASTATVSVVYPLDYVPRVLDGSGYVVPRAEGRPLLGCTWTSTKFPHRAPEGFALIRAFLGRAGDDSIVERTDEDLLRLVRDELRSVLGICKEPKLTRIYRWPKGMPQYTLGHLDRVERIERLVGRRPGLFVAGSALRGVGIPDCIESGEQAAAGVLRFMSAAGSAGSAQPLAAER
ncbi:MAG: protoporphyrinogen oxidase, partial [Acidobacteriota bacterium]